VKPPPMILALTDAPRALLDVAFMRLAEPWLQHMPAARDRHSVLVLPGFLGDDLGNGPLIRYLRELGYLASGWRQGRNLGTSSFDQGLLTQLIGKLAESGGGRVSLIGHSLGGLYAREIARQQPDSIRQVITLGSPFGPGHDAGSHATRLYRQLNPSPDAESGERALTEPPPVPTTAIYTRGDGVVNWRTSRQAGDFPQVKNIRVPGSHIGLNRNALVWYWIARKLAAH